MKIKNANLVAMVFAALLFSGLAFFVAAQERLAGKNIVLDSDQDGLTDEEEKTYGTDPKNPDTDGDSYSDGAEVKSGYDPKKPAPGDKISGFSESSASLSASSETEEGNLTEEMAEKMAQMIQDSEENNQNPGIEDIQKVIGEVLSPEKIAIELPKIEKSEIKIKKQNYSKYSDKKAKELKKEDFSEYISAVFYVLASHSPEPITSTSDIVSMIEKTATRVTAAITLRSAKNLSDLSEGGKNIAKQLKEIEVPEELADIHLKTLRYAEYLKNLEKTLEPNEEDPMTDIVNLSKIAGFIQDIAGFSEEINEKLAEYEIEYEDIQENLEDQGLKIELDEESL